MLRWTNRSSQEANRTKKNEKVREGRLRSVSSVVKLHQDLHRLGISWTVPFLGISFCPIPAINLHIFGTIAHSAAIITVKAPDVSITLAATPPVLAHDLNASTFPSSITKLESLTWGTGKVYARMGFCSAKRQEPKASGGITTRAFLPLNFFLSLHCVICGVRGCWQLAREGRC